MQKSCARPPPYGSGTWKTIRGNRFSTPTDSGGRRAKPPFVSLTYKSCPENMLPREYRRPLYKSQSRQIDNSINRREGWEDDQYSYPPLGKSPRKMGSRARSTGVGTSTGGSGTFRQGEKRTRAKSSTHPPEQGPSPSPDMPRKTQRTETQPSEGRPSTNHTLQQLHHLNQQEQEQEQEQIGASSMTKPRIDGEGEIPMEELDDIFGTVDLTPPPPPPQVHHVYAGPKDSLMSEIERGQSPPIFPPNSFAPPVSCMLATLLIHG